MTQLIVYHQGFIKPYLRHVIQFMLDCTKQAEVAIVMESCEFWVAFVDASLDPTELQPKLGELLPILLNNMACLSLPKQSLRDMWVQVYEDDDEAVTSAREADEVQQEDNSQLRPFVATGDGIKVTELDADTCHTWTLRKCSAAGLDKLSTMFGNELLQHVFPLIQRKTCSPDWKHRECAILVLGAISDGCRSALQPMLAHVLEEILSRTTDTDPLVRIISCWSLSRYAERIIDHAYATQTGEDIVSAIFDAVLNALHDNNRQVQLAACSALATIEEYAGAALLPRLKVGMDGLSAHPSSLFSV